MFLFSVFLATHVNLRNTYYDEFFCPPNVQPPVKIACLWHDSHGPLPFAQSRNAFLETHSRPLLLGEFDACDGSARADGSNTSSGATSSSVSPGPAASSGLSTKRAASPPSYSRGASSGAATSPKLKAHTDFYSVYRRRPRSSTFKRSCTQKRITGASSSVLWVTTPAAQVSGETCFSLYKRKHALLEQLTTFVFWVQHLPRR